MAAARRKFQSDGGPPFILPAVRTARFVLT